MLYHFNLWFYFVYIKYVLNIIYTFFRKHQVFHHNLMYTLYFISNLLTTVPWWGSGYLGHLILCKQQCIMFLSCITEAHIVHTHTHIYTQQGRWLNDLVTIETAPLWNCECVVDAEEQRVAVCFSTVTSYRCARRHSRTSLRFLAGLTGSVCFHCAPSAPRITSLFIKLSRYVLFHWCFKERKNCVVYFYPSWVRIIFFL